MFVCTVRSVAVLAATICLLPSSPAWAQTGFEELLRRAPQGANAVVLINVEKALNSPVAKERNWRTKLAEAFNSGAVALPPHATYYVEASLLDFETMTPAWETTLVELRTPPKFDEVVAKHGATPDKIGGHPAAAFPHDAYVVQFGPKVIGAMQPANRQHFSRWVREADAAKQASLSPYLREAADFAEFKGTEVILAIDLADVISPELAERGLKSSEMVKEKKGDIAALTKVLSGLRGVMLGITFRDKTRAKIKVDFQGPTAALGSLAGPILLEALKKHGAMIDDFEDWKASTKDKHVFLEGELSPSGLRRLLTLVAGPPTPMEQQAEVEKPATSSTSLADLKAEASRQYFNAVASMVSDIAQRTDSKTLGQYGVWLTQYARKIENMSTAGVDADVAKFGLYAASQLRTASSSVKGIGIQSAAKEKQIFNQPTYAGYSRSGVGWNPNYGYGSSYGSEYGFYYHDPNIDGQRRAVRAEEKAKGMTSANDILSKLEADTAEIRRQLNEKYPPKP